MSRQSLPSGAFVTGTCRMDDVVPAMLEALRRVDPSTASQLEGRVHCSRGRALASRASDDSDAYVALYDALQEHVPAGHYVGTDIDGGSDIGVWPLEHTNGRSSSASSRSWTGRIGAVMSAMLGMGSSTIA